MNNNKSIQEKDLFLPPQENNTAELLTLFRDVDSLIVNKFIEIEANKDKDENEIRHFVAGHVCFEMLNEIRGNFLPHVWKKNLGPWNIFVSEEMSKRNYVKDGKKSSFKDKKLMGQLAHDLKILKENYPEELKMLEGVVDKENERSMKVDMRFRCHRFKKDWGIMRENLEYFRDNYRTHIVMLRTTDTKHDVLYPSVFVNNSVAAQEASQEIQSELKSMNLLGFLERQLSKQGAYMKGWEEKETSLHTSGVNHWNPHLRSRRTSRSPPRPASGSRCSTRSVAGYSPLVSSFSPAPSLPVPSSPPARSAYISSADYILRMTYHGSGNNEPPKKKKYIDRRQALVTTIRAKGKESYSRAIREDKKAPWKQVFLDPDNCVVCIDGCPQQDIQSFK
ncbi:hypothetical protein [Parasitella parasitica]|uniref:Uncharacterized protein n=1 Tax=Parasitella parasitica TaxID=35722 RepID=A0A0B7NFV0_9FUNG|nr:hypothetical protein [Parasitella parasitica]